MDADWTEWANLALRWFHVIAGISWIGQTYLFNWMEKVFRTETEANLAPNVVGKLWMVHGGGFYLVEKQRAPVVMPRTLHWFKWESFFTWVSGVLLLLLVYYLGGLLVDPEVAQLSSTAAMAIGLGTVVGSWLVYDAIWRSPLGKREPVAAGLCFLLLCAVIYGLTHTLSARAAFLHVGALFGTIMFLNVWVRILPGQSKMLKAVEEMRPPDLAQGKLGGLRSKHNTYLSFSVVFIMLSTHFPTLSFGNQYNFVVLPVAVVVGFVVAKRMRG